MRAFLGLICLELRLAWRHGSEIGVVLGFLLLAAVLSLDRLFATDYADRSLDLIAASPLPLEFAVLAKGAAHWLTTGLPLAAISPVLAIVVDLDMTALPV